MKSAIIYVCVTLFQTYSLATNVTPEEVKNKPNLRHRNLAKGGEMCLDLGPRRGGNHSMRVTASINKLLRYADTKEGRCPEETNVKRMKKSLKKSLSRMERYCKRFNKELVTIVGPEIIQKWMKEEVQATYGPCEDEDEIIIIEEIEM